MYIDSSTLEHNTGGHLLMHAVHGHNRELEEYKVSKMLCTRSLLSSSLSIPISQRDDAAYYDYNYNAEERVKYTNSQGKCTILVKGSNALISFYCHSKGDCARKLKKGWTKYLLEFQE